MLINSVICAVKQYLFQEYFQVQYEPVVTAHL